MWSYLSHSVSTEFSCSRNEYQERPSTAQLWHTPPSGP